MTAQENVPVKISRDSIANQYEITAREWRLLGRGYSATYVVVGILTVVFSTFVASKPFGLGEARTNGNVVIADFAWITAMLTGAMGFLNPHIQGDRHIRAYRHLSSVITFYKVDHNYQVWHLEQAVRAALAHIQDGSPLPPLPTPND